MSPTSYQLLYSAVYWAAKVEIIFYPAKFFSFLSGSRVDQSERTSSTGQWSEPNISLWMSVPVMRGARGSETRK